MRIRTTSWGCEIPNMFLGRSRLSALALAASLGTSPAFGLQPLHVFLEGADKSSPEQLAAVATQEQREQEDKATKWRLFPSLSIAGSYTRNQYNLEFAVPGSTTPQPFMPHNQWDASVTLNVPIVNVTVWKQKSTTAALNDLAEADTNAVRHDIKSRVALAYFQVMGSTAVRKAAEHNLQIAQENAQLVQTRRDNGAATELDVERARANVAQAEQNLSSSKLSETISRQNLRSISGVEPSEVTDFPADDLHSEPALDHWIKSSQNSPTLVAGRAARTAAEQQGAAAQAAWYPTINAMAQQRFTNATALVGHPAYYLIQLNVAWHFDGANLHTPRAQDAAVKVAHARELQSERAIHDSVHHAFHQVKSGIERSQFARVQDTAATRAVEIAQEQYLAGVTTQLEVLSAQQAAFAAEVSRIQADTDLAYARTTLRLLAAQEPTSYVP